MLNQAERNYTVTERECLAVIYSYQQFRVYLHGTKFKVVTDHASLQWLKNLKEPEGRLARWAIKLQAYNYTIEHRAGSKHQNADGLSRLPTIHALIPEADRLYDLINKPKEWDNELLEIRQILDKLSANTTYDKGQLFKGLDGKLYLFVKLSNRPEVIKVAHLLTGHGGLLKTMEQIKKDYYWEIISFDVTEYINSCLVCQSEVGLDHQLPTN